MWSPLGNLFPRYAGQSVTDRMGQIAPVRPSALRGGNHPTKRCGSVTGIDLAEAYAVHNFRHQCVFKDAMRSNCGL